MGNKEKRIGDENNKPGKGEGENNRYKQCKRKKSVRKQKLRFVIQKAGIGLRLTPPALQNAPHNLL